MQVEPYAHHMTDSLDTALAPARTHLRNISDPRARYERIKEAGKLLTREELKQLALELRAEKKTWKEIGQIMGGVTYQRAFQIAHGE